MWSHAQHAQHANHVPDDVEELGHAVNASRDDQAHDHQLKLTFYETARLWL